MSRPADNAVRMAAMGSSIGTPYIKLRKGGFPHQHQAHQRMARFMVATAATANTYRYLEPASDLRHSGGSSCQSALSHAARLAAVDRLPPVPLWAGPSSPCMLTLRRWRAGLVEDVFRLDLRSMTWSDRSPDAAGWRPRLPAGWKCMMTGDGQLCLHSRLGFLGCERAVAHVHTAARRPSTCCAHCSCFLFARSPCDLSSTLRRRNSSSACRSVDLTI